ncbi:MAG: glycosyltransferase [Litorimonas sp.]
MTSVCAIIAVRNERIHMNRVISQFVTQGIDVVIIDNGSTDGSRQIAESYLGKGVLALHDLPWSGEFSLSDQLRAKSLIIDQLTHDWIIHADADEWLLPDTPAHSLKEWICVANDSGFNCINFHELVFAAAPGENFNYEGYENDMLTYYFFNPSYPRLNRAWKRTLNANNIASAGHKLDAENLRYFPNNFILRHYIMLSEEQGRQKYVGRRFSNEDLSQKWHGNRTIIKERDLFVKPNSALKTLSHAMSFDVDLSTPIGTHFWQWPTPEIDCPST